MILTRATLAPQLERIKAHWPSMPATGTALDGYLEALRGFDDGEVAAAVTLLLNEYDAMGAPKPKHLRDYAGRVAKYRRADVGPAIADGDGVICSRCGTRTLVEAIEQARERVQWRLWPMHAPDCPLAVDFPESHLAWPPRHEED